MARLMQDRILWRNIYSKCIEFFVTILSIYCNDFYTCTWLRCAKAFCQSMLCEFLQWSMLILSENLDVPDCVGQEIRSRVDFSLIRWTIAVWCLVRMYILVDLRHLLVLWPCTWNLNVSRFMFGALVSIKHCLRRLMAFYGRGRNYTGVWT